MPSTYAHYCFGQDVLSRLPKTYQKEIQAYQDLYFLGLHGPDLLFYYRPLKKDPVNQTGYAMHDRAGQVFFEEAGTVLQKNQFSAEYAAYIYGFICHFALDRECHGYIDEKIASSGVRHAKIEVEFDRSLLVRQGIDPVKADLVQHIHPSKESAFVISQFFPQISEKEIDQCIKSMRFYNHLLRAPGKFKRGLISLILKISGNEQEMQGLMIGYHPDPQCEDSNMKLMQLYEQAVEKAVKLICDFCDSVSGKIPYDMLYRYTFGSQDTFETEENVK